MKKKISKKPQKLIPSKKVLEILKDKRERRFEMDRRWKGFKEELENKVKEYNVLVRQLGSAKSRIEHLEHLIKMYKVSDNNGTFDIWKLEVALGITDKNCPDWRFEFEKTEEGKLFKDGI
jgi:hypothetical protein